MYAVVELMGHRTRAGLISDATLGGATLLRIEHPTLADHTGDEPLTEYYAASAIFSIRPCSLEEAQTTAAWAWRRPITGPSVAELARPHVDDDIEDGDVLERDDEMAFD